MIVSLPVCNEIAHLHCKAVPACAREHKDVLFSAQVNSYNTFLKEY